MPTPPPPSLARWAITLVAPWALGALAGVALLWHLHGHGSLAITATLALALGGLVAWLSAWYEPTRRRGRRLGALRGLGVAAALVWLASRLSYTIDDPRAWALWIPAQALSFLPTMVVGLPGVTAVFVAAYLAGHWALVVRRGQLLLGWPLVVVAAWMFVALKGFYRNSFVRTQLSDVVAQPGVRLVSANPEPRCTFFVDHCSARSFPRTLDWDPRRGRLFACFGATDQAIARAEPKLLVVEPATGKQWSPEATGNANQMRHLSVDPASRFIATSAWAAEGLTIFDADTLEVRGHAPRPPDWGDIDFTPAGVYVDGDHAVLVHIYPPILLRYDLIAGAIERKVDLRDLGLIEPGGQVDRGVISRARRRLWLPVGQLRRQILEVDLDTLAVLRTGEIDSHISMAIAIDDVGGRLFSGRFDRSSILILGLDELRVTGELRGKVGVRSMAYDPARDQLHLIDYLRGSVHTLRVADGSTVRTVMVGPKPDGAVVVGDELLVSTSLGVVAVALGPR